MADSINILVVDGDPIIIRRAWRMLNHEGHSVEGVLSGKEAMHKIEQNHYDLVFTALNMHGIDGISLIKWIKQSRPLMSIIVIAHDMEQETIREAHKLGITCHLRKSFTTAMLKDAANMAVELIKVRASGNDPREDLPSSMLTKLDKVINQYRDKPNSIMMVLLDAQEIFGYLPSLIQERIARLLNIYPSEIRSIVLFYPCFRKKQISSNTQFYKSVSGRLWWEVPWKTGKRVNDAVNEFIRMKEATG